MSKKSFKNTTEELEFYWKVLIKAMAGFVSELSGLTDNLASHHIAGKPNDVLRFDFKYNGICCTSGEHKFGYHNTGMVEQYREKTKKIKGQDIYERLEAKKHEKSKGKIYYRELLLAELKPHKEAIIKYLEFKDYKSSKIKNQYKYLLEQLEAA